MGVNNKRIVTTPFGRVVTLLRCCHRIGSMVSQNKFKKFVNGEEVGEIAVQGKASTSEKVRLGEEVAKGGAKTSPSKIADIKAKPRGNKTAISEADDAATTRSLTKENESAETLAKHGYDVEQNPLISGTTRKPDYLIESKVFDCYSPSSSNTRNIASNIELKVTNEQAKRIILNIDDSAVTLEALK